MARERGGERKTVRHWLKVGQWQPRYRPQPRAIDLFAGFIERRGPEVGWNGVVLQRELTGLGFAGGYQQVQRFIKTLRYRRRWAGVATVRFETEAGEQAQVGFGQLTLWSGGQPEGVHLHVF